METQKQDQPKPQYKRRILFIKKEIQLRYMFLIVISVVLGLAIMGFEVVSALQDLFNTSPMLMQPLYDKLLPITLTLLLKVAIYLALVVLTAAVLSHKMAGPIYRIEKTCQEIAAGDFSKRVYLRTGDKFTELRDDFNKMMDVLESEIKKNKKC